MISDSVTVRLDSRYPGRSPFGITLTICTVVTTSLMRESDYAYLVKVGTEICVASTKAFTV